MKDEKANEIFRLQALCNKAPTRKILTSPTKVEIHQSLKGVPVFRTSPRGPPDQIKCVYLEYSVLQKMNMKI